jgi:hypothetical protein
LICVTFHCVDGQHKVFSKELVAVIGEFSLEILHLFAVKETCFHMANNFFGNMLWYFQSLFVLLQPQKVIISQNELILTGLS